MQMGKGHGQGFPGPEDGNFATLRRTLKFQGSVALGVAIVVGCGASGGSDATGPQGDEVRPTGGVLDGRDRNVQDAGEDTSLARAPETRDPSLLAGWVDWAGSEAVDQGLFVTFRSSGAPKGKGLSGVVAMVGRTEGALVLGNHRGRSDAFVRVLSQEGQATWTAQVGGEGIDLALGAAFEDTGALWVAGQTNADFEGFPVTQPVAGFVMKFSPEGERRATRVFDGTPLNAVVSLPSTDSSNVGIVAVGTTPTDGGAGDYDALVVWMRGDGQVQRELQSFVQGYDAATTVAASGGSTVVVGGFAEGDVGAGHQGETDGYVVRWDLAAGKPVWVTNLGSSTADAVTRLVVDGNQVLVTGYAGDGFCGQRGGGDNDAFLAWLSLETGEPERVVLLGTEGSEGGYGVASDGAGGAWVVGRVDGARFPGAQPQGLGDAYALHVDGQGTLVSAEQWGGSGMDEFQAIDRQNDGTFLVVGYTEGGRFPFGDSPHSRQSRCVRRPSSRAGPPRRGAFTIPLSTDGFEGVRRGQKGVGYGRPRVHVIVETVKGMKPKIFVVDSYRMVDGFARDGFTMSLWSVTSLFQKMGNPRPSTMSASFKKLRWVLGPVSAMLPSAVRAPCQR